MALSKIYKLLITLTVALCANTAFGTTIDFQNIPSVDNTQELQGVGAGTTLTTQGFVFTGAFAPGEPSLGTYFMLATPLYLYNKGTNAVLANEPHELTTLTQSSNQPFSIFSIDLAELSPKNGALLPGNNVTFYGKTASGQTVSANMKLDDVIGWEKFVFPSTFRNLTSLSWTQGGCWGSAEPNGGESSIACTTGNDAYMFDNLVVSGSSTTTPTPVPTPTCKPGKAVGHCDDKFVTPPPTKTKTL